MAVSRAEKEAARALAMATHDVPTMARQLYEAIGALEHRVAALEDRLGASAPAAPRAALPHEPLPSPPQPVPTPVQPTAQPPMQPTAQPTLQPAFEVPAQVPHAAPIDREFEPPIAAPPSPSIDWEQWIGVRGAAAAGALVLALAGVYFFRYSIEHGLISPTMRVVIGTLVGLSCVVVSEVRLRHVHRLLAQFLAGAGFAILYLGFWASNALYHLVPTPITTVLMIAVTAASCTLAYVRHALPVAALGLLGGFATPILLSTGQDRPIALFAYLAMLDLGLLALARRRRWTLLALAAFGFTLLYQASWFTLRLDAPRMWLAVAITALFGILFAWLLPRDEASGASRATRSIAILAPGAAALYFGATARLGENFVPTAALLIVLTAGCAWLALREGTAWLRTSSATLAVVTVIVHATQVAATSRATIETAVVFVLLLAVQFVASESARRAETTTEAGGSSAFDVVLFGGLLLEFGRAVSDRWDSPYVHLATIAILFLLGSLDGFRAGVSARGLPAAGLVAIVVGIAHARHALDVGFPPETVFLAVVLAAAILAQVPALAASTARHATARLTEHGAGLSAAILTLHLCFVEPSAPIPTVPYLVTVILLLLLAALVATRQAHGGWLVATMVAAALAHLGQQARIDLHPSSGRVWLIGLFAFALVASLLPALVGERARSHVGTFRAASLAGPSVLLPALATHRLLFTTPTKGAVPLALALFGLVTLMLARRFLEPNSELRRSGFAWSAAASLSLVSVAIPIQLRNEWITVGWALQGAAVTMLGRRIGHRGLLYYGMALFAAAFTRLCLNPEVLAYHPPSGRPVLNWIAYTYLVPLASMLFGARELARVVASAEGDPTRSARDLRIASVSLGLAAIVVGFVFVNLTVIDAFAVGRNLELPVDREPARDLTISLAWAVYATGLLAIGMWRKSSGLRKTSLALVLLTCSKVFLYDLGNLRDLYRVASLVGLAFALILISLAYKRFVFRDESEPS